VGEKQEVYGREPVGGEGQVLGGGIKYPHQSEPKWPNSKKDYNIGADHCGRNQGKGLILVWTGNAK